MTFSGTLVFASDGNRKSKVKTGCKTCRSAVSESLVDLSSRKDPKMVAESGVFGAMKQSRAVQSASVRAENATDMRRCSDRTSRKRRRLRSSISTKALNQRLQAIALNRLSDSSAHFRPRHCSMCSLRARKKRYRSLKLARQIQL